MLSLFTKYGEWKILFHFLKNPTGWFHIKGLARLLKVSPSLVSSTLKKFEKFEILILEKKGLAHFYQLNNSLPLVQHLKIVYILYLIKDKKIVEKLENEEIISLALYGSYAKGIYDERSDLDLLIISQKPKRILLEKVRPWGDALKITVNPEIFTLSIWQKLKRKKDVFYQEVSKSYILLKGSDLS